MVELISVHIGKTAGTAFLQILLDVYGRDKVLEVYTIDSGSVVPPDTQVIHGHFSTQKYQEQFSSSKWIVWLRHPIFRLISQYFYSKTLTKKNSKNSQMPDLARELGILEFAKLPEVQNRLSTYFGEMTIDQFNFVGIQEFFTEDVLELKELMGWHDFQVVTKNTNRYPGYKEDLRSILEDRWIMNQLALINDVDMELYNQALDLRAMRRKESKVLQYTLAEWNRFKGMLAETEDKVREIEGELEQSRFWLKQAQTSQNKADLIDIVKSPTKEVSQELVGFGITSPQPHAKLESDSIQLKGWVIGKNAPVVSIRVSCENQILCEVPVNKLRPKVFQKYPDIPTARQSGFEASIEVTGISLESSLQIQAVFDDKNSVVIGVIRLLSTELNV